jgi:hypothetical protein
MEKSILFLLVFFAFVCCKKKTSTPEPVSVKTSDTTKTVVTSTEPAKVYLYAVVATPTASESITLKNNSGAAIDISAWTLGDSNNSTAYSIPANTVLSQGELKTFSHTTLGFQINDSGEVIYLKNTSGVTIDSWAN